MLPVKITRTIKLDNLAVEQNPMVLLDLVESFMTLDIGSKLPSNSKDATGTGPRIIGNAMEITSD